MESTQIHLDAVEESKKVNKLYEDLIDGRFDESILAQIASSVRFFGKNVGKLPECNEVMLKLARAFILVTETNSIEWSLRDSNAFLLMTTTLLLKRKDEIVIRKSCGILKEFASLIPESRLKNLAKIHQKPTKYIFSKISKVSTYFTQMKLLEVLHIILRVLDDGGASVVQRDRLIAESPTSMVDDAVSFFGDLSLENYLHTSRNFLDFYNLEILKKPFIYSIRSFLFEVNNRRLQPTDLIVDFNMRNLSVSFFVNAGNFRHSKSKDLINVSYFVEVEDSTVEAERDKFSHPDHIELILKPKRSQVLDKNEKSVSELKNIEFLKLVVTDKSDLFWNTILPMFKDKTPQMNDNITDQESLASFRTLNTGIEKAETTSKPQETTVSSQQIPAKIPEEVEIMVPTEEMPYIAEELKHTVPDDINHNVSEEVFTSQPTASEVVATPSSVKQEPKSTKATKVKLPAPSKSRSSLKRPADNVYDEVPRDDEVLPPFSKFLKQKRVERLSQPEQSQVIENTETTIPDNSADLDWIPGGVKKPLVKKRSPPKKTKETKPAAKKTRGRGKSARQVTSDVEEEVEKTFGKQVFEILPPPKKRASRQSAAGNKSEPKKTKKRITSDLTTDDDIETIIIPTVAEQKREALKKQAIQTPDVKPIQVHRATVSTVKVKETTKKAVVAEIPKVKEAPAIDAFDALLENKITKESETKKRLANKRVSFNEEVIVKKRSRTESSPTDTPMEVEQPNIEEALERSDEDIFLPYTQRAPPRNQVVHDFETLKDRHMLGKYITELKKSISDDDFNNDGFDEMIITNTQHISKKKTSPTRNAGNDGGDQIESYEIARQQQIRVQKKSPPTIVHTVAIQEINYTQPEEDYVEMEADGDNELCRQFQSKASHVLEPLVQEIRDLRASLVDINRTELKAKLREAVVNCRDSSQRFQTHVEKHVDLLKRIHHSKRVMDQICDEDLENVSVLRKTVKEAYDAQKAREEKLQQANAIRAAAFAKQEEVKQEVWRGFINGIQQNLVSVLQKHSVI